MSTLSQRDPTGTRSPEYEQARRRVERKRKFFGDLAAYVLINALLIGMWAVTGFGYFWPGWVLGGWGLLLALDARNVFIRMAVTDADIEEELRRRPPST